MMAPYNDINYDEFFSESEKRPRERLPRDLRHFKWQRPGNNYVRVRYPNLHNSFYELQFSHRSEHHQVYWGVGPHIILAFYYMASLSNRNIWIDSLSSSTTHIGGQLGKDIKIGLWGKEYAGLMMTLDDEIQSPGNFSYIMTDFINATYEPVTLAYKAMGI